MVTALIVALVIGAIAGWLAGLLVQGTGFGLLGDIIVGQARRELLPPYSR